MAWGDDDRGLARAPNVASSALILVGRVRAGRRMMLTYSLGLFRLSTSVFCAAKGSCRVHVMLTTAADSFPIGVRQLAHHLARHSPAPMSLVESPHSP